MQPFPYFSLLVEGLMFILLEKEMKYLYYKQHTGTLIVRRSADVPQWVKWVHHVSGLLHCPECWMDAGFSLKRPQCGRTMRNAIAH